MPDKDGLEDQGFSVGAGTVIGLIVLVGLIAFGVQNRNKVSVSWLFFDRETAVWVIILVTAIATLIMERLVAWGWRRRQRKKHQAD